MKIVSEFMTNMISKVVKKVIRKKSGYDIDLNLNNVRLTYTNGKAHIHLDVDAELTTEELIKVLKNAGLN